MTQKAGNVKSVLTELLAYLFFSLFHGNANQPPVLHSGAVKSAAVTSWLSPVVEHVLI